MAFYRKGLKEINKTGVEINYNFENLIEESICISHQRSPCYHTITALSIALAQAQTNEFKQYQKRVVENSKYFVNELMNLGYTIVSNGTDNYLALIDLHNKHIGGAHVEKICELCNIALNKNTVPGDKSAMNPGGIRVGTPVMTTRGCLNEHFKEIALFINEAVNISINIQNEIESNKIKDFKDCVEKENISNLKANVIQFAKQFHGSTSNENIKR